MTDLRQPTSQALGALAAYTTVTFDPTKFSVVSPITYGPKYQNNELPSGGGQPTNLQDVGALAGSQGNIPSSIGSSEQLVYKVELEAIAAGTSNIDPGQPDSTPLNPLGIILYPDPPATECAAAADAGDPLYRSGRLAGDRAHIRVDRFPQHADQ